MLAGTQRGNIIVIMSRRRRQIQDDIHIRILKQFIACIISLFEAVLLLPGSRLLRRAAGTGIQLHFIRIFLQICQIGIADIPKTDDTYT